MINKEIGIELLDKMKGTNMAANTWNWEELFLIFPCITNLLLLSIIVSLPHVNIHLNE